MAVMQMQRFSICALKKDRKAILEELQLLGVVEIDNSVIEDTEMEKMNTAERRQIYEKHAALAEHALSVLQKYVPEKTSMFSSLEGKPLMNKTDFEKIRAERKRLLTTADDLMDLSKRISENAANVAKLENQIESLVPWMNLDIPMNYRGTAETAMFLGTMPKPMTVEEIRTEVAKSQPDLEAYDLEVLSADKDLTYLTAVCLKGDAAKLEEALRAAGFARPSQVSGKIPSQWKTELEAEIEKLKADSVEAENRIKSYEGSREELKAVSDYYRLRADKYQVLGQIPQTKQTFVISGYIPEVSASILEEKIARVYDCSVEFEEIGEEEEPPVLLKNNKISRSVEGVLESYGLPHKGEVDPTTVMSVFYIVLFGMMLSDAAYGLLISVACFIALKKFPRMSDSMNKSLHLFGYCGISTFVWGVLFGGYFGDVIDVVARTFFGRTAATSVIPALWFVPLNNPMKLLVFSLGVGVVHLFFGLGLKGYSYLKSKDVAGFICDVVFWYMLLIGLILMLIPSSLFASIAQTQVTFSPFMNTLAKALAIIGALGLLFFAARDKKNIGLRLALGAYELYNITGWLSDVLSYSRLLALGLATGVIASVVNQMGSMFGGGVMGAILFILVFIVGHTLNLGINLLGAYVHTNRLQFVEFFGKFYEGGGKPFEPFKENTKYVEIKED